MLVPYASAQTDTALNLFKDEECYWTGLWVDPVVFAVNEDYVRKHPAFPIAGMRCLPGIPCDFP